MNWLYINAYLVAGIVFCLLLVGWWIHRSIEDLKNSFAQYASTGCEADLAGRDHDAQHQALLFLMTRKTDSVLAALARTIDAERQKLGMVVRKTSTGQSVDTSHAPAMQGSDNSLAPHEQILPMAGSGVSVATIARRLQLPEAEVATIVRLNAA
jgi:hypothetical protein